MDKTLHTPYEIELLLKIYYSFHYSNDYSNAAETQAVWKFVHNHMIELEKDDKDCWYELTEKGKAFVDMILNTPYPIQTWTDPRK